LGVTLKTEMKLNRKKNKNKNIIHIFIHHQLAVSINLNEYTRISIQIKYIMTNINYYMYIHVQQTLHRTGVTLSTDLVLRM